MAHPPEGEGAVYPPAPWAMSGQAYLSVFRLRTPVDERHPAGTYAVGFVSYDDPSPLLYNELVVARPSGLRRGRRRVTITDIWVDSADSVAGGRDLWAIPKGLADFSLDAHHTGPLSRTDWSASVARRPIAEASFSDLSRAAPRLPSRGGTYQPSLTLGGPAITADMRGSARTLPCRGRWHFDPDGPLDFLREARQVASLRMAHFRMLFG